MAYENELIGCDPNTPARAHGPAINTPAEIKFLQQYEYLPKEPDPSPAPVFEYVPSVAAHGEGELPDPDGDEEKEDEGGTPISFVEAPEDEGPHFDVPIVGIVTGESVGSEGEVIVEGATAEPVTSTAGGVSFDALVMTGLPAADPA